MTAPRRVWLGLAAAAALLVVACVYIWSGSAQSSIGVAPDTGSVEPVGGSEWGVDRAALETANSNATKRQTSTDQSIQHAADLAAPSAAVLPPRDTPLALIHEDLRSRAMRGDTRANCRLSYELGRCRRMEVARAMAEGFATNAEGSKRNPTAEGDNIDMASRLMELSTSDERICGTEAPPDANEAWKYLLRAADQGHVPSMLRFVIQPPLREDKFTEDLEGWRAYTANAGRLLRAAGATGDPRAFHYLWWAHAGYPTPGGTTIVEINPSLALAYAIAAGKYADEASRNMLLRGEQRLRAELTHEQIQFAEREGNRLAATATARLKPMDLLSNVIPDSSDECDVLSNQP